MTFTVAESHLGVNKIDRYGWKIKNQPGRLAWLDKNKLTVDGSYQREPKHKTKILEISRNFNWVSLGVIIVAIRDDGNFYVIDGQHRTLAAMNRSDVEKLPCIIHESDGPIDEAKAFIETNTGRKSVTQAEQHKAKLMANDATAIQLQAMLDASGRKIVTGTKKNGLKAVGLMNRLIKTDKSNLDRVWPLICELTEGEYIHERLIHGLVYLESRMPDGQSLSDNKWSKRILKIGAEDMARAAGEGAAFFSKGGAKPWAMGMMNRINKGLSHKLEIKL